MKKILIKLPLSGSICRILDDPLSIRDVRLRTGGRGEFKAIVQSIQFTVMINLEMSPKFKIMILYSIKISNSLKSKYELGNRRMNNKRF